jgi:dephospho-CoA kinase
MIKAGLTGGYGTGKSTVTRMFAELGVPTINADEIVRSLLSTNKEIINKITDAFGTRALSKKGDVDRKNLADIVFADEKALATLTGIVHPIVRKEIYEWFRRIAGEKKESVAVAEVSMLIEGGALEMYDKIILVAANAEIQKARCLAKGISEDDFMRRLRNQMPLEKKRSYADYVIENSGSLDNTKKQVVKILNDLNKKVIN